jgi:hypothetical protein
MRAADTAAVRAGPLGFAGAPPAATRHHDRGETERVQGDKLRVQMGMDEGAGPIGSNRPGSMTGPRAKAVGAEFRRG